MPKRRSRRARLAPYTPAQVATVVRMATGEIVAELLPLPRREYLRVVHGSAATR